jgi:hypothetical protein
LGCPDALLVHRRRVGTGLEAVLLVRDRIDLLTEEALVLGLVDLLLGLGLAEVVVPSWRLP